MATDLADHLVQQGVPFREAHGLVGKAVKLAAAQGKALDELSPAAYQDISPFFGPDVHQLLNPETSLARHNVIGGSAPQAVKAQIKAAKQCLAA
jgi:argininosuccinate lyase